MQWKVAVVSAVVAGLATGCSAGHASGEAPRSSHAPTAAVRPKAATTLSPTVQAQVYQPDTGEEGSACELLPSAAVNALFGPLQPFDGGDVNNVSLTSGFDINGNPYCVVEWYTGTAASDAWQVTVGAVQPTTDAEDSLSLFLSGYHTVKVAGGVTGEIYGQGESGGSVAGDTVAAVPMSGGSYLYVSGAVGGSTPLSAADMTKMLRVMVAMAMKYPVSGLKGIGSLP